MKVISVEGVSKKFILAHDRPRNLADAARGVFQRKQREDFWALKDVSFEVEQGEALGIIGHNGAGKSTMLKLLTRIMDPTKGRIRTRGRVSALIEVGAGFHPEMTGRENVYLNGSIIGMTRREIDRKFDEIVAFAELERFIDTPVKRYSSGMYARLGFAVAAHVDPEILIVDEVLSVGDENFQQKCQQRMAGLRSAGISVVFVSHNLSAVVALCDRAILINAGVLAADGESTDVVSRYRELPRKAYYQQEWGGASAGASSTPVVITSVRLLGADGNAVDTFPIGEAMELEACLNVSTGIQAANVIAEVHRADGVKCAVFSSSVDGIAPSLCRGECIVRLHISCCSLVPGRYSVSFGVLDPDMVAHYDVWPHCADLVVSGDTLHRGVVWLEHDWRFEQSSGVSAHSA